MYGARRSVLMRTRLACPCAGNHKCAGSREFLKRTKGSARSSGLSLGDVGDGQPKSGIIRFLWELDHVLKLFAWSRFLRRTGSHFRRKTLLPTLQPTWRSGDRLRCLGALSRRWSREALGLGRVGLLKHGREEYVVDTFTAARCDVDQHEARRALSAKISLSVGDLRVLESTNSCGNAIAGSTLRRYCS